MAKKPKPQPQARRNVRQRAEDTNRNPFVGLTNKVMNIAGVPAIILAVAGWIYHGIEDTKTQVQLLQNTVVEQHAGTAGDIQQLRDWLKGVSQQVAELMKGKH